MECICGHPLRGGDSFCINCGRSAALERTLNEGASYSRSKARLAVILAFGIVLIICSLISGVQEATNSWRLRSVGVSTFATHVPLDVRHFTSLLPVAGIVILLLALCGLLAKELTRFTLSLAIAAVTVTLLGFQVAGYLAAAHRNHVQNQIAVVACDYCSAPFPSIVAWGYLAVTVLLLCVGALAVVEVRASR